MFYDLDSTHVSLQEYRWGTPLLLMPVVMLLRLLRVRLPGSSDDPAVDSLDLFRVPREVLPEEIRFRFQPLETELANYGFVDPVYHAIDDPGSATRIYQATYRHSTGTTLAKLHYRHWSQPNKTREYLFAQFLSGFGDGSYLVSSAGKADLLAPPNVAVNRQEKATLGDLWRSHQQQYSLAAFGKVPVTVYSAEQMLAWIEQHHAVLRDFHVQRGVFVPRDDLVLESLDEPAGQPAPVYDSTTAAVLAEIRRSERSKSSWGATLLILLVTGGFFYGLGRKDFDATWLMLVVGVLFVHELGHLGAMWLFGYRNLRMFFIPFLGAAASGKNYNAAGWKRAMVSLMGPLPGIYLGIALGIVAWVMGWKLALQAAFLLVAINGFNLLPIIPLDGGWIMHVVLFCRHPILDVAFRVAAVALLFLLGVGIGPFVVVFIVAIVMSLPRTYRMAQVVQHLRQAGMNAASPDAQTIPTATAAAIIGELRRAIPNGGGVKNRAQMTLQVFESLNARPPEVLGSLAFLGVHGMTFVLALIFTAVFAFGMHGGMERLANLGRRSAPHPVDSAAVLVWKGPEASPQASNTLVADFPDRPGAEAAYRQILEQLPKQAAATLFGQTLFVALPAEDDAAREKWLNELEQRCPHVFVDSEQSFTPFRLSCRAPDAATARAIAGELESYLPLPATMYPVPPWSKEQSVTPEQQKARRTYLAVQKRRGDAYGSPRVQALQKRVGQSRRRGDRHATEKLQKEIQQAIQEEQQAILEKMRQDGAEPWDLAVLDLCKEQIALPWAGIAMDDEDAEVDAEAAPAELRDGLAAQREAAQQWNLKLGERLGQLPLRDGKPREGSDRRSTRSGAVTHTGASLQLEWWRFVFTAEGAAALVEWLAQKGCREMQYELLSSEL